MAEIIKFKKRKQEVDKHELYKKALDKLSDKITAHEAGSNAKGNLIKVVNYAVMYIKTMPRQYDYEQLKNYEQVMLITRDLMSCMTFKELKQCYPIGKKYDGERWECKDYFTTIEWLQQYDENDPIGDKIDDVLWDYFNPTIVKAHVNMLCIMSDIQRANGKQGLMEKFAQDNLIPTYTEQPDGTYKADYQKPNLTVITND